MLGLAPISSTPVSALLVTGPQYEYVPMPLPRYRYTRQPQGPVVLDKGHPLAKGLVFSTFNTSDDATRAPRNYVNGRLGTRVGSSFVTRTNGLAATFNNSTEWALGAVDLSSYRRITVSFLASVPPISTGIVTALGSDTSTAAAGYYVYTDYGAGVTSVAVWSSSAFSRYLISRPSDGREHQYVLWLDLDASQQMVAAFIDGVQQTLTYNTQNMSTGATWSATAGIGINNNDTGTTTAPGITARCYNVHKGLLSAAQINSLRRSPWAMFAPAQRVAYVGAAKGIKTVGGAIIHRPIKRQPYQRPVLNRSHPLARSLLCSALNAVVDNYSPINYVTRQAGSRIGGQNFVSPKGVAFWSPGSTTDRIDIPVDCSKHQQITISMNLWTDSYGPTGNTNILDLGDIISNTGKTGVYLYADSGTGNFLASVYSSGIGGNGQEITRPSAGKWHNYAFLIDINARPCVRAIYVDKVARITTTNGSAGVNATFSSVGATLWQYRSLSGYNGKGKIQNFNIHAGLLTPQQIASLADDPYQIFAIKNELVGVVSLTTNLGGPQSISGVITVATVPYAGAVIRLCNEATGEVLRTTSSDVNGKYHFGAQGDELDPNLTYTVLAYDTLSSGFLYNIGGLRGVRPGQAAS